MKKNSSPSQGDARLAIDVGRERYPCAVVWTPIPVITWILPFIGHMGICDSEGVIHDFCGPFFISVDSMAFGDPVKYWDISDYVFGTQVVTPTHSRDSDRDPAEMQLMAYDRAVYTQTEYFRQTQNYNFFCNNCHSFTGRVMEAAGLGGAGTSWGVVKVAFYTFIFGRYLSFWRFMKAHLPFFIIVAICVVLSVI